MVSWLANRLHHSDSHWADSILTAVATDQVRKLGVGTGQ